MLSATLLRCSQWPYVLSAALLQCRWWPSVLSAANGLMCYQQQCCSAGDGLLCYQQPMAWCSQWPSVLYATLPWCSCRLCPQSLLVMCWGETMQHRGLPKLCWITRNPTKILTYFPCTWWTGSVGFADYNLSGATVSYPLVVSTTLIRLVLCSVSRCAIS